MTSSNAGRTNVNVSSRRWLLEMLKWIEMDWNGLMACAQEWDRRHSIALQHLKSDAKFFDSFDRIALQQKKIMKLVRISEKHPQFGCPSFTSRKPNWHYQCTNSWIFYLFGRCRWQANEAWFVNLLQEKMQALAIWVIPELLNCCCRVTASWSELKRMVLSQEHFKKQWKAIIKQDCLMTQGVGGHRMLWTNSTIARLRGLFQINYPKPDGCVRRRTKQNRQSSTYFLKCAATVVRYQRFWMELSLLVQEPIIFVDFAESRALWMLSGQLQTAKLSFTTLVEHFHNIQYFFSLYMQASPSEAQSEILRQSADSKETEAKPCIISRWQIWSSLMTCCIPGLISRVL